MRKRGNIYYLFPPSDASFDLEDENIFHLFIPRILIMHNLFRKNRKKKKKTKKNKTGYTATPVACGWAGAIFEVSGVFGQERYSQKPHKRQKSKV